MRLYVAVVSSAVKSPEGVSTRPEEIPGGGFVGLDGAVIHQSHPAYANVAPVCSENGADTIRLIVCIEQ